MHSLERSLNSVVISYFFLRGSASGNVWDGRSSVKSSSVSRMWLFRCYSMCGHQANPAWKTQLSLPPGPSYSAKCCVCSRLLLFLPFLCPFHLHAARWVTEGISGTPPVITLLGRAGFALGPWPGGNTLCSSRRADASAAHMLHAASI